MQTLRHILTIVLVFAILTAGLPLFSPEDANRDSRLDLKDAVLHVQDFARTADNPAAFAAGFEKAVSALQALAGLKTVIKPADNAKSTNTILSLDISYLTSSYNLSTTLNSYFQPTEKSFYYQSITSTPASRPPQASLIC